MRSDWLLIVPGKGQLKETAKELLRLAGSPALVRTTGNGLEFLVPPGVAQAFTAPLRAAPVRKPKSRGPRATSKSED